MNKISLVFFATPDIALNSFLSLVNDSDFEVKALVTRAPKPANRGKKIKNSKIKEQAVLHNIPVIEPVKLSCDENAISLLEKISPDFFVTFAYGQILTEKILNIPKYETINLHASLLPKYRGANPICECLLNGDKKTGITTMITVLELDAGDICLTKEIDLDSDTNYETLAEKISAFSPNLIKETLKGLYSGTIKPYEQNDAFATFTKKMKKEDKFLNFSCPAETVHNKIRAFCGVNTAHFVFKGKLIKVLKSTPVECSQSKTIGEVLSVDKKGVLIACSKNAILVKSVKPEGKNTMSAYDWSLGSKIKKGDIICTQEE
ncbi:MAG: methionyl-tRNA formyltransferase [Candidatus Gastranaerophilales bacterium]|nr:methionyl-tRNA formyltransferase [Candidatus Gastranaerophilales bacterium]